MDETDQKILDSLTDESSIHQISFRAKLDEKEVRKRLESMVEKGILIKKESKVCSGKKIYLDFLYSKK